MILQRLRELAQRERLVGDPDFPLGKVSWRVTVTADGAVRGITDLREEERDAGKRKPRLLPRSVAIPYQRARSGTAAPPAFLVDNAKYVFGCPTPDKAFTPEEGRQKSGWFLDLVQECAAATNDDGIRAVARALAAVRDGTQAVSLPDDCKSNDQFVFRCEPDPPGTYVHERPAVREWWRARRRRESGGAPEGAADAAFRCLLTGEPMAVPDLFPKVKNVPGGQSAGVSLVSFNAPAFESYGLRGNQNAPIGRRAAEEVVAALQRLVDRAHPNPDPAYAGAPLPRRHVQVADDTLVCFWTAEAADDAFVDVLAPLLEAAHPDQVAALYRSVWLGQPAPVERPAAFYALTLSGAQGRLVVRDWFEGTIAEVNRNLARYFADLEIARHVGGAGDGAARPFSVRTLVESLAAHGKRENVPPALAGALVRCALQGLPFPIAVLQRAVERARAEAGALSRAEQGLERHAVLQRRDARAALIRAVFRRAPFNRQLPPDMDPTSTSPGYLCGRLMAVLERLQQAALGDVNAGVVDRYFGAASASPRLVFTRLLKNRPHWVQKADDGEQAKTARWLDRQLDEIVARMHPREGGFPAALSLEEQGMFLLGYHQQRHWLWMSAAERERWAAAHAVQPAVAADVAQLPASASALPVAS